MRFRPMIPTVFASVLAFAALTLAPPTKAGDLTTDQMLAAAVAGEVSPFEAVEAVDVTDIDCHASPWYIPTYSGCTIVCCSTCNETNPPPCFHRVIDGTNYCYGPVDCSWPALPAKLWSGTDCAEEQWQWYLERRRYYEGDYLSQIKLKCKLAAHPGASFPWACDSANFYDCTCLSSKRAQLLIDLNTIYETYKWRYKNFCIPCDPWTTSASEAEPRTICDELCNPLCCEEYNLMRDIADLEFHNNLVAAFHDCDLINAAFATLHAEELNLRELLNQCCQNHGPPGTP